MTQGAKHEKEPDPVKTAAATAGSEAETPSALSRQILAAATTNREETGVRPLVFQFSFC